MLKFVLIGVLVLGVLAFILWNLWKTILLKHKYFSESQLYFGVLGAFSDVPGKLKAICRDKIVNWLIALVGTALIVAVAAAYFLVARNVFLNDHVHKYKDSVLQNPTCVQEGVLEQKCRYCGDRYEEPIATIAHKHTETGRVDATCTQEGAVEYTCEMCRDVKTEAISVIDHKFAESSRLDATCTQEGSVEYTCQMCAEVKTEVLPLTEHTYTEKVELEANCTTEGVLAKYCQSCENVFYEVLPVNGEHSFEELSFTRANFWKNGYTRYSCAGCGEEAYGLRVAGCNWMMILAIVILLISVFFMIGIRADDYYWSRTLRRPMFWIFMILVLLSVAVMVFHWGFAAPGQTEGTPKYTNLSKAPVDCVLVEVEREASTYTENGTVTYQCETCKRKYTEYLPLKEMNIADIPLYQEPTVADSQEQGNNDTIDGATDIPMYTKVAANLTNEKDVDFFKVTLATNGNITFKFTHEGNEYSNHWDAAIYDADKTTVLKEGYINTDTFGCENLAAGTYYLKISPISGGNPFMNQFSDAKYYLQFVPQCAKHGEVTQYFVTTPACGEPMAMKTVCNLCGAVVSQECDKELQHRWGDWEVIKPGEGLSSGEKMRVCELCGEAEHKKFWNWFD